ncbi:hypothetical protein EDB19DRAFT_1908288 [Suillus lakei]|nr:hypothetical protein EDB19DRAFT_1908288 [Suillus lakei]
MKSFKDLPFDEEEDSIFIQVSPSKACHFLVSVQSDVSSDKLLHLTPTSPFTPSSKESVHQEPSDNFESHNHPRHYIPGSFLDLLHLLVPTGASTPSTTTSLTHSSIPTREPTPTEPIARLLAKASIKQEPATSVFMQKASKTHVPLFNPAVLIPSAPILPTNPLPTTMAAVPFTMPIRSIDSTPKFDGKAEHLVHFIDDFEHLADQAGLADTDHIKGIISRKAKYTLKWNWVCITVSFSRSPDGFLNNVQTSIRTQLLIKFPDQHPDEPYPFTDVLTAAEFLLPGMTPNVAMTSSMLALSPHQPTNATLSQSHQQPPTGTVVKQEYLH